MVTGLSLADVDGVLAALAAAIEPVDVRFAWRPQLSDPDDRGPACDSDKHGSAGLESQ